MKNNHAYLRLPKIIVNKNEVGFLLDKYDKIEFSKYYKLDDITRVKVIPYVYIKFEDYSTIIGACVINTLNIPLLTGLRASKNTGVISYKIINRLIEIEKKYNINLNISKDIRNKSKI